MGAIANEIDWYKLLCLDVDQAKNGVGIFAMKELVRHVDQVGRKSNRIMSIKLVGASEIINAMGVYAIQIDFEEDIRKIFKEDLDEVTQIIYHKLNISIEVILMDIKQQLLPLWFLLSRH